MIGNKKLSNKYEAIRELRRSKNESVEDNGPAFTGPDIPIEEQWELFTTMCHHLHDKKRWAMQHQLVWCIYLSHDL